MTKLALHIAKLIVAIISVLFISFNITGCGHHSYNKETVTGSGNITTQKRDLGVNFTGVIVKNGLEVAILQGDETMVNVTTDDNLQEHLITEIENNTLIIYTDAELRSSKATTITVQMPDINSVKASSSATVWSDTPLRTKSLILDASSSGSIEVMVVTDNIECESSSSSSISVKGTTKSLYTKSSSSGYINAKELNAEYVSARASSSSTTIINPHKSLNAKASSSASIQYTTTPEKISEEVSSSGSVSKV